MFRILVALVLVGSTSVAVAARERDGNCNPPPPALTWFGLTGWYENGGQPEGCSNEDREAPPPYREGGTREDQLPGPPSRERDDGDGTP